MLTLLIAIVGNALALVGGFMMARCSRRLGRSEILSKLVDHAEAMATKRLDDLGAPAMPLDQRIAWFARHRFDLNPVRAADLDALLCVWNDVLPTIREECQR